jgi:hypothetical protein
LHLLLALLLLAGGKPVVKLEPSRRILTLPAAPESVTVTYRLLIDDKGDEDYYCPRVEWEWEDGTRSSEESDCPPFGDAGSRHHRRTWRRDREYWDPGVYGVCVRLFKADRMVRFVDTKVEVRGQDAPQSLREGRHTRSPVKTCGPPRSDLDVEGR